MTQPHEKAWRAAAGINGFLALVMGAAGTHAVSDAYLSGLAREASMYQLIHAAVLLWLADRQGFRLTRWLVLAGVVFFCGSLYLKALTGLPDVTRLAPLGGVSLMAGWLALGFSQHAKT